MFHSRDIDIFVFVKTANFKICDAIISYTYAYFFRIPSPIKMKFGEILVCCMANISNMFLAECWRLEASARLFYNFLDMTIQQDLVNF